MKTSQKNLCNFSKNSRLPALSLSLLLLFAPGCQSSRSAKPELTLQVQPTGQLGTYTVSGRTNLPDRSKITIQAVRSLKDTKNPSNHSEPNYAVLAKSQVSVKEGQWKTTLNTRQTTPDGQSVESWQRSDAGLGLTPDSQIQFVAVTEPSQQDFEQQPTNGRDLLSVRFTADGKSFLQIEQTVRLEPPTAKLSAPASANRVKSVPTKPADASPNVEPPSDGALPERAVVR